jgi:hypothetical protein
MTAIFRNENNKDINLDNNCIKIFYNNNTLTINSLLFGINDEARNDCIEHFSKYFSEDKRSGRYVLEYGMYSSYNKYNNNNNIKAFKLSDLAVIKIPKNDTDIKIPLSSLLMCKKGTTFYEGNAFLRSDMLTSDILYNDLDIYLHILEKRKRIIDLNLFFFKEDNNNIYNELLTIYGIDNEPNGIKLIDDELLDNIKLNIQLVMQNINILIQKSIISDTDKVNKIILLLNDKIDKIIFIILRKIITLLKYIIISLDYMYYILNIKIEHDKIKLHKINDTKYTNIFHNLLVSIPSGVNKYIHIREVITKYVIPFSKHQIYVNDMLFSKLLVDKLHPFPFSETLAFDEFYKESMLTDLLRQGIQLNEQTGKITTKQLAGAVSVISSPKSILSIPNTTYITNKTDATVSTEREQKLTKKPSKLDELIASSKLSPDYKQYFIKLLDEINKNGLNDVMIQYLDILHNNEEHKAEEYEELNKLGSVLYFVDKDKKTKPENNKQSGGISTTTNSKKNKAKTAKKGKGKTGKAKTVRVSIAKKSIIKIAKTKKKSVSS